MILLHALAALFIFSPFGESAVRRYSVTVSGLESTDNLYEIMRGLGSSKKQKSREGEGLYSVKKWYQSDNGAFGMGCVRTDDNQKVGNSTVECRLNLIPAQSDDKLQVKVTRQGKVTVRIHDEKLATHIYKALEYEDFATEEIVLIKKRKGRAEIPRLSVKCNPVEMRVKSKKKSHGASECVITAMVDS